MSAAADRIRSALAALAEATVVQPDNDSSTQFVPFRSIDEHHARALLELVPLLATDVERLHRELVELRAGKPTPCPACNGRGSYFNEKVAIYSRCQFCGGTGRHPS